MANFMRFDFSRGAWTNSTDGGQTFSDAGWCLLAGTLAARPAAGVADRMYFATDANEFFYDNGATWVSTDTLDGQNGAYYLARANHTGTQAPSTISPQGAGSGLDADKLDGKHATDFSRKFGGAHVYRSAAQTISNQVFTFISWDTENYDTDSIWSSSDPTKLVVPSGVTRVRLNAGVRWADKSGTTSEYGTWFNKNKTEASAETGITGYNFAHWSRADTYGHCGYSFASPVIPVVGGDFFKLVVYQNTGGALTVNAWMAMELIQ